MGPVRPAAADPVVAALSESIGGPVGGRAGRPRWWTPVRVLLALTALTFALGMVQKAGCVADNWSDTDTRYRQMCYSDLPYLYTGRGLAELTWPYSDEAAGARYPAMEYPVGIAYWAWGTAWVTHLLVGAPDLADRAGVSGDQLWARADVQEELVVYVAVNAVGFALLCVVTTWLLARVRPRRPWDAAAFALSPALLVTGLINWDATAVVLVAGALVAWSRDRPGWTGVLIGLGAATKLYPLFLLGGVLVLCWRDRRWRDLAVTAAAAAGAWLLANAPAYLVSRERWEVFWTFNADRGPDLGSLWLVLQQVSGTAISPETVNRWSWLLFAAWCLGVLVIGLRARRTPTLAELGFLIVAGFLLVNKVYSPQYVLWLLPLAVLARPRWRDQLLWQGSELVYFAAVWWYLGGFLAPGAGGDSPFYWLAIAVRAAGQLFLVGLIVRSLLRRSGAGATEWGLGEVAQAPLTR